MVGKVLVSIVAIATMLAPSIVSAGGSVTADLAETATLVGSGEAADIDVTVTCPKGYGVLEAFVYITQDDYTSQFSSIAIKKCKDKPVTYSVRVTSFEEAPFHRGEASASSYVLVSTADDSETVSGGEFQPITIV